MGFYLRRVLLQHPIEGWQVSTGFSGSFPSEWVATFNWNQWQVSIGISGNFRAEYAGELGGYVAPPCGSPSMVRPILSGESLMNKERGRITRSMTRPMTLAV